MLRNCPSQPSPTPTAPLNPATLPSAAALHLDDVSKSFGSLCAVDQLSLTIQQGETFGLLGPNGAGKSTTISMIVGLLPPDVGTVSILSGTPGSPTLPQVRRHLGLAPQALSLYEELTALDNLRFFGKLYGLHGERLQQRVEWCLDFSKLRERQHDRVGTFSGGMQRRLNLAVALIHEPHLVLLDEPTVGVDPQSRNHVFDCIEQLKSAGLTIIYTTHYMEEAQRLCDRVGIIDGGRMLACDTVPELIRQHAAASTVRATLGEVPPSVSLPGEVIEGQWQFDAVDPMPIVTQLAQQGVEFATLTLTQPTLESVFLKLTGRSLRD